MFKDPLGWFPNAWFSTLYVIVFFGVYLLDSVVPRLLSGGSRAAPVVARDRGSFQLIQLAGIIAIFGGGALRYFHLGLSPVWLQYVGLDLAVAGLAFREWAIVRLGRFFARTVQVEQGHRLIKDGPYRWLRHPAYTGMLAIYFGLVLALGTWVGAILALAVMFAATFWRIRIEEQVLLDAFGDEYRAYMQRTWRLIPGW